MAAPAAHRRLTAPFWKDDHLMLFSRFRKSPPPPAAPAPVDYRACDDLGALTRPFSPLIGEMLAVYCHTRPLGALSQSEKCLEEYRMTARQIIHHLLEGWQNQTDDLGTIDDLLIHPRQSRTAKVPTTRAAENAATRDHHLAS
ncbi:MULTISPECIES: hypothetical protein [unclassified Streptomyces]|uniref:hypothetical protein n=1 Tax=unclassified Streptomyces TaxID=2593676 RepID=UPI002E1A230C|nr:MULTISPECIES: hypothetical protein [unclassified Streptomyces]WSX47467.1 hypothetical protein OG760_37845 [Streptomyces sp. NBC_00963]